MLGIILESKQENNEYENNWIIFILAPFVLPILIGIKIEELTKK